MRFGALKRPLIVRPPAASALARSMAASPVAAPSGDLEVERKFIITPEIEARIAADCSSSSSSKTLIDTYYDSVADFALSRRDAWLRRRNKGWELKWPAVPLEERVRAASASLPQQQNHSPQPPVDHYLEFTATADICARLGIDPACGEAELEGVLASPPASSWVASAGSHAAAAAAEDDNAAGGGGRGPAVVAPFVSITTRRRSYRLDPTRLPGCGPHIVSLGVDVDEVLYGHHPDGGASGGGGGGGGDTYAIAEVEVMVRPPPPHDRADGGPSALALGEEAERAIDSLCERYGIPKDRAVLGKVLEFLRRHRPGHYAAVVDVGLVALKTTMK
jgi:hypothetical protein